MRSRLFTLASLVAAATLSLAAQLNVTPSTTLAAETGNNTSAASSFTTLTDGDAAPVNISKVPTRTLLYSSATTAIYAHFMAWFGGTNHMNVGYSSDDTTQVHKQISDMLSRGIQGMIIDWYGTTHTRENTTSIYVMKDAETRGGAFVFAIMEDGGQWQTCSTCLSITQQVINDLNYVYSTFEVSSAYMRVGSRPVIFFFNTNSSIDWNSVTAGVKGNPMLIFRNSGGFTYGPTSGAYSWVGGATSTDPMGIGYLDNFYKVGISHPAEYAFGSAYKGFNDTLASWGKNRIVNQQCGQTWLSTFSDAGKHYGISDQLDTFQLVTWNDYEEGTEIETGIDNCVSISASVSGSLLNWSITGQENTLDHYTPFISLDGVNLMPLPDVATGTHSLDLSMLALAPNTYTLYVKAVGRPGLLNHMSAAVSYKLAPSGTVTLASPINQATVSCLVPVSATAQSSSVITAMQVYLDSKLVYQQTPAALSTKLLVTPGAHNIVVKAWDSSGASYTAAANVTAVNQAPHISLSGVAGNRLTLTASTAGSFDPDGSIASTSINFGDGVSVSVSSGGAASHTYQHPGTYVFSATVTDNFGATATTSATVTFGAYCSSAGQTGASASGFAFEPREPNGRFGFRWSRRAKNRRRPRTTCTSPQLRFPLTT
jgi:hypothetical protein